MADVFSKTKRSEVMARIRSRGNKATEVALAKLFRRHKITGWRRQVLLSVRGSRGNEAQTKNGIAAIVSRKLVGASSRRLLQVRPDFVFSKSRTAIFVDGCFWHGCPKHETKPRNNRAFWQRKFLRNKQRDALVTCTLRKAGWRVLRIWEHELARKNEARLLRRIQRELT